MSPKEFEKVAGGLFSETLSQYGFTSQKSIHAIFYRELPGSVFHFIGPDFKTRGQWFDVKVFPSSPKIDPLFIARFPDALAIPSDTYCYLNKHTGVGSEQQAFKSESAAQLQIIFEGEVKPLLLKAVSYLDRIKSIDDMVPLIKSKRFLGLALHRIGNLAAARQILEAESLRLEKVKQANPGNRDTEILLDHIEHLLKEQPA